MSGRCWEEEDSPVWDLLVLAWRLRVFRGVRSGDSWEGEDSPGLGLVSFGIPFSCLAQCCDV